MSNRGDRWGAQQRVAQLEQRIGAAGVAGVQLGSEGAEPRKGGSWHRHDRAACLTRMAIGNLSCANNPTGLNHKLRGVNRMSMAGLLM
jgi:hypothetical protein